MLVIFTPKSNIVKMSKKQENKFVKEHVKDGNDKKATNTVIKDLMNEKVKSLKEAGAGSGSRATGRYGDSSER